MKGGIYMVCPKCQSENVKVDMIQVKGKTNNAGPIYWLIRGTLILCTAGLWLLVPTRRGNTKFKNKPMAICQSCGNTWNVKN